MKIIDAIMKGFLRSVRAWKGALIICLSLLIIISFFAIPAKGILKTGFGSSMATEELLDGLDIDIISDLGANLKSFGSYLSSGVFLVLITGMMLFVFFSGGLFNSLKGNSERFSVNEFFRASAANFWHFLGITLIISLIIFLISFFLMAFQAGFSFISEKDSPGVHLIVRIAFISLLILALSLFSLVADFARAKNVKGEEPGLFRSIGYGFKMTFGNFSSAVPLMIVLVVIQALFGWVMMKIILVWKPVTGGAVFLLFILSQVLFFIRILLRSWRYASVSSLMERLEQSTGTVIESKIDVII